MNIFAPVTSTRLAQSVERKTMNLEVRSSMPVRCVVLFIFFMRVCFDLNADFGLQTCLRHHGQAYGLLELALLAVHGLRPRNAILAFPPF